MTTFADYARRCPHCSKLNPWDAKICVQCKNVIKVVTAYPAPPWLKELFEAIDAEWRERRARDGIDFGGS